jgi:hypothetical protein
MTTKTFDAVRLMRDLRDKLSREMEHLTAEARMKHIRDRAASTNLGKMADEGRADAAEKANPADRPSAGS